MKPSREFVEEHTALAAAAIRKRRVLQNVPPGVPVGYSVVESVLDVGPCISPMQWFRAREHVCIEPYEPHVNALRAAGYVVWRGTAQEMMPEIGCRRFDSVFLLDVIEHMERAEAAEVLLHAQRVARCQVVVFTPNGFVEQDSDNFGLGADHWQTHRSGWTPEDFPGWRITPGIRTTLGADNFYAVWDRC